MYAKKVIRLDKNDIFDCDVLAFTVATFIPPVGSEIKDVRMAPFRAKL